MHLFRPVFVLLGTAGLLVAPWFGASAANDLLAAVLARMDSATATFRGLSADVRKASHTAVINEDTIDNGTILVRRMKGRDVRYLIDIKPPNPMSVLIAGHRAQVFHPNSNTVEEYDFGVKRDVVNQFLLLGFGSNSKELQSAYSLNLGGTETVAGQKTTRIELIPKSPDVLAQLRKVELWIADDPPDAGIAVQQKLYMPGGDYSLATYTNVKINPDIPDSSLRLNLPKGVKVQRPQK
jgi:outer membrane lipoprotein-sorting protein